MDAPTLARSLHSTVKTSKRQCTRFPEKGKKVGRREEEQKRAHQPESVSTVDTLPREERRGGKEESFLPTFFSSFLPLERELVVGWCRRRPLVLAQLACEKKNFSLPLLFPEELFFRSGFSFLSGWATTTAATFLLASSEGNCGGEDKRPQSRRRRRKRLERMVRREGGERESKEWESIVRSSIWCVRK